MGTIKKIEAYIKKKEDKLLIQAFLPSPIVKKIDAFRVKKQLSWSELVLALFERLAEEEKLK